MSEYSISESILPPEPAGELSGRVIVGDPPPFVPDRLRDTPIYIETDRGEWVPLLFPELLAPISRWLVNMRGATVVLPGEPREGGKFELDLVHPFYLRGRPRASVFTGRLEAVTFEGGCWITASFEDFLQQESRGHYPLWMEAWWRMTGYSIHVCRMAQSLAALRD